MLKQEILKKYPEHEDKILVSKLLDKIKERDEKNKIGSLDFLNIHEIAICEEVLKSEKVLNYVFTGGYEEAERKILILYPNKFEEAIVLDMLSKWILVIRITLPKYNSSYSHREYLGGLMKLGIKREKIGDIIVNETGAEIIVTKDITDFLLQEMPNLTRFSKANIEQKNINELKKGNIKTCEITIIVPSYRIDAILSEVLKTSRNKISDILNEEKIFINGCLCKKNSKIVQIGDKITVRGKGKFEISEELGNTKKGNIIIKILKYC